MPWKRQAAVPCSNPELSFLNSKMSKLTGYADFLAIILRHIEGTPQLRDTAAFNVYSGMVSLPFEGVAESSAVYSFYEARHKHIQNSCLTETRKSLWSKFAKEVVLAYTAVATPPAREIPAEALQKPIRHIFEALTIIMELRDHDAQSPVCIVELVPYTSEEDNSKADNYWRKVKLESLRPCLFLALRMLEIMMPDRLDFWEEYRKSLLSRDWKDSFINDSPESRRNTMLGPLALSELRAKLLSVQQLVIHFPATDWLLRRPIL